MFTGIFFTKNWAVMSINLNIIDKLYKRAFSGFERFSTIKLLSSLSIFIFNKTILIVN